MKTLTALQIEELYQFTRQHYVEYYDVQTELVDHLANDIEAIWEKQPSLTFDQAREISFKKFGVFGFMGVVEEKQKQINRKYWKRVFQIFKQFFKAPQILITITICLGIFTFLTSLPQKWTYLTITIIGVLILSYQSIKLKRLMNKRFKLTKKNGC